MFSESQKREIAGRARTLFERLDGPNNVESGGVDTEIDDVLSQWKSIYEDEDEFYDRIAQEGLTVEEIETQLKRTKWPKGEALPQWINNIESLGTYLEEESEASLDCVTDYEQSRPFVDFVSLIVEYAWEQLSLSEWSQFTDTAIHGIKDWLHNRLTIISRRVLFVEFKSFVAAHDAELARADPADVEVRSTKYYDAFIERLLEEDFTQFCMEYPVYARLLVQEIEQWKSAVTELSEHLSSDKHLLETKFGDDTTLGAVAEFEALTGDTHADGRAIYRIRFEDQTKVVYKPRPISGLKTLYSVLNRLHDRWELPAFDEPEYVQIEDHSWIEYIQYSPCHRQQEVRRYYQRAGALIFLSYLFEFTDVHLENILVNGESLFILDAETMFTPYLDTERSAQTDKSMHDTIFLSSMITPSDETHPERDLVYDFPAIVDDPSTLHHPELTHPIVVAENTDVMAVERQPIALERKENIPQLNGEYQKPSEYIEEIQFGFEQAHKTVYKLHAEGQFIGEILTEEDVRTHQSRVLYRHTTDYFVLLRNLLSYDSLRDGVKFTVTLDELVVSFFDGTITDDSTWQLCIAERKALKRLDVPRFTCPVKGKEIYSDGQNTGVTVDKTGYQRFRTRLKNLESSPTEKQLQLLKNSFK